MSNVLLFVQQQDGKIPKSTLIALSAARALKESWKKENIVGVCLGKGSSQASGEILNYGLSKVFFSERLELEKYLAIPFAAYVQAAIQQGNCDTFVAAA